MIKVSRYIICTFLWLMTGFSLPLSLEGTEAQRPDTLHFF